MFFGNAFRIIAVALLAASSIVLTSCGKTAHERIFSVVIEQGDVQLKMGETAQLSATVETRGDVDSSIVWHSNEPTIATVASDGTLTAVNVGSAKITATSKYDSTKSASVAVEVGEADAVLSVVIERENLELRVGDSLKINAIIKTTGTPNLGLIWESDNLAVLTISDGGLAQAIAPGVVNVTATSAHDMSQTDSVTVVVVGPGEGDGDSDSSPGSLSDEIVSIAISHDAQEMHLGDVLQLSVSIKTEGNPHRGVVWLSDAPDVAQVDSSGTVTAVGIGTAIVSVISEHDTTKRDEVAITVLPPLTVPSELRLLSFELEAALNSRELRTTVSGRIDEDTIHVLFSAGTDLSSLVATYSVGSGDLFAGGSLQESGVIPNNFGLPMEYVLRSPEGFERRYSVKATVLDEQLRNVIPHLYIETEGAAPVDSKEVRVPGTVRIDGMGEYEDYLGQMEIRGRGNSSWSRPKKPYQIKLESSESLLGLPKGKRWILLANWTDPSLMGNAIAMRMGRLLEMPFTHNIIPVDVTLNGEFVGSYVLTEHKEVRKNRIDLESLGDNPVYIELTPNRKSKHYMFTSDVFGLPAVVRYPELGKTAADEVEAIFTPIVEDFLAWENLVADSAFPDNGYRDYFDIESLSKYLLVHYFAANKEISRPNSVYMYAIGGVYHMGPLWDFDWAWGTNFTNGEFFDYPNTDPMKTYEVGGTFFYRLMEDPVFLQAFEAEWERFKTSFYPELLHYIEGYLELIRESYDIEHQLWPRANTMDIDSDAARMFKWFGQRVNFMDRLMQELKAR